MNQDFYSRENLFQEWIRKTNILGKKKKKKDFVLIGHL